MPADIQKLADKCFELWQLNPAHPSLRFKPLAKGTWSVRIGLYYRAIGHREEGEIVWIWIGSHAEYDKIT